jgi:inner membrane protein
MGLKLIVVCGLALMMTIPALFIEGLVEDRTSRAADVVKEIGAHVGGQQSFLGPTLVIPYNIPAETKSDFVKHGMYIVFPARASADVKTSTEERRRSLFKVPVFQADLKFDAAFDLTGVPAAAPQGAVLDWSRAEIVVGVSDARGALADALLIADGKTVTLAPAEVAQDFSFGGDDNQHGKLALFGAKVEGLAKPNAQFNVASTLRFSGAQRIAVLAYGKTTHVVVAGDWASPGFDGGFLPIGRSIAGNGFTAEWSVPFIARGVAAEGRANSMAGLDGTELGVSFVEVADPYQSVNRSLKYVLLFLGLIFLSYFIFEVMTERIGFDFGFLIAGTATVALLSANAAWVFASRLQGMRALAIFTFLYVLIYMLLRLEDNAMLLVAIASFVAVAATMYFTRGIDWYSSLPGTGASELPATPLVPKGSA